MGEGCIVRIEKLDNGYEVEIRDQKAVKQNKSSALNKPYVDPWRAFAFKDTAEVLTFLEKNLEKASPEVEFSHSFDMAAAEDDDEE